MRDGFITVACGAPKLRLADCDYNAEQTFTIMRKAEQAGVKVLVLPELGLTGYSCGDLFYQDTPQRQRPDYRRFSYLLPGQSTTANGESP